MTDPLDFNPLDPTFYLSDPHAIYGALRRDAPVRWNPAARMWTIAAHADVMAISRDPATFCSSRGVLPTDGGRAVAVTDSILFMDPPEHARHRKLVSSAFTPKRVAALEPVIREIAASLVARLEPGAATEFVEAVAAPLPMLVIANMLGIPGEDRDRFREWSDAMIAAATDPSDAALVKAAELYAYFDDVTSARKADPRDDIISLLVNAEVDGELLSRAELLGFCMSLLVAGNETTRNLIAGGTRILMEHPDQLAVLASDPTAIPRSVEEMLRWVTPVMCFARTATRDVEVGGVGIASGDFVLMLYASANRDEAVFGELAASFDIARDPNPHVGFGFGEHFCLGAALARLEARVLFEELFARFSRLTPAGHPERLASVLMNGLTALPLVAHI
ncbi:MAG TPA: cytochrome P450 [Acidimicrobiia bacterium]|nr:cytochrome P450 [Acidimicrobiia bacterium]